jgi:hypothetical protein
MVKMPMITRYFFADVVGTRDAWITSIGQTGLTKEEIRMFNSIAILNEIKKLNLAEGQVAYVSPDGDWTIGKDGCQPAYTQAVSQCDLDVCSDSELIEHLDYFHYVWRKE